MVYQSNFYAELMKTMVESWRTNWDQGDFYFFYAQIAPFKYDGKDKMNIEISLIDHMDTTEERLRQCGHRKGNCKCIECDKLRRLENKWILRLGTFNGDSGLNDRNIINSGVRVQF